MCLWKLWEKILCSLHVADQELNGDKTVKLLDKGYLPVKEYKKNIALTTKDCYKTGIAEHYLKMELQRVQEFIM